MASNSKTDELVKLCYDNYFYVPVFCCEKNNLPWHSYDASVMVGEIMVCVRCSNENEALRKCAERMLPKVRQIMDEAAGNEEILMRLRNGPNHIPTQTLAAILHYVRLNYGGN